MPKHPFSKLYLAMVFMTFHIDGTERTSGTKVFARTTTDASFGIHNRNLQRFRVIGILSHHLDGTSRTMALTITTTFIVSVALFPPVLTAVQVTVCVPTANVLVLVYAVLPILYVVVYALFVPVGVTVK